MKQILFLISLIVFLVLVANQPRTERAFYSLMADLDLNKECARLAFCLNALGEPNLEVNRCIIRRGTYERRFHFVELRGGIRACEITRGVEGQGRY